MTQIKISLLRATHAIDEIKQQGNTLFSDIELALFCLEKFKDPAMRHTLSSLDDPIEQIFKRNLDKMSHMLQLLLVRSEEISNPEGRTRLSAAVQSPVALAEVLKSSLKVVLQLASECSSLEAAALATAK